MNYIYQEHNIISSQKYSSWKKNYWNITILNYFIKLAKEYHFEVLSNVCSDQYSLGHEGYKLKDMLLKDSQRMSAAVYHENENMNVFEVHDHISDEDARRKIQKREEMEYAEKAAVDFHLENILEYATSLSIPSLPVLEYATTKYLCDLTEKYDTIEALKESIREYLRITFNIKDELSLHFSELIRSKLVSEDALQLEEGYFRLNAQRKDQAKRGDPAISSCILCTANDSPYRRDGNSSSSIRDASITKDSDSAIMRYQSDSCNSEVRERAKD